MGSINRRNKTNYEKSEAVTEVVEKVEGYRNLMIRYVI